MTEDLHTATRPILIPRTSTVTTIETASSASSSASSPHVTIQSSASMYRSPQHMTSTHFATHKGNEYLSTYVPFHNTPTVVNDVYGSKERVPRSRTGHGANGVEPQEPIQPITPTDIPPETQQEAPVGVPVHLEIAQHPVDSLIKMLSALLSKIIKANDSLHSQTDKSEMYQKSHSKYLKEVLAFHGKNVPAISLENYLHRILKYCPVTNEVFLSLLVYFDRIAKKVNKSEDPEDQLFVMDSYNIHRLIIAAVRVSSKFFSDIFYKNSRYAKVGGLPLDELNHLEIQFLVLCDFKLMISVEELQRYANLLAKFWEKESA